MTNIIGINGYIGSGKDTVGFIIQALTSPSLQELPENWKWEGDGYCRLWNAHYKSEWQIKKFAAKLKQIASLLTGIPAEKFEDQDFKKLELGREWDRVVYKYSVVLKQDGPFNNDRVAENQIMTVREFLQKLGTEGIRNGVHENAWVNALFADYRREYQQGADSFDEPTRSGDYPKWIITDVRFPNEAQAIVDRGGIVIRVDRRFYSEDKLSSAEVVIMDLSDKHPSETSLDKWDFDYRINNNGSLEELTYKVKEMLQHFNLLS